MDTMMAKGVNFLLFCVFLHTAWSIQIPKSYAIGGAPCDGTISIQNSAVLTNIVANISKCDFAVQTDDALNKLLIQATEVHLLDPCNETYIELIDEFGNSLTGRLCNSGGVYNTTTNVVKVNYRSSKPATTGRNVSILITSFHTGNCYNGEFKCNNGYCISNELTCNGYNECADNSDEGVVCGTTTPTSANTTTPTSTPPTASTTTPAPSPTSTTTPKSSQSTTPNPSTTTTSKTSPSTTPKPTTTLPPSTTGTASTTSPRNLGMTVLFYYIGKLAMGN